MGRLIIILLAIWVNAGAESPAPLKTEPEITFEPGNYSTFSPTERFNSALELVKTGKPLAALAPLRGYLKSSPWDVQAWELLTRARELGEVKNPGGETWWYWDWRGMGIGLGIVLLTLGLLWTAWTWKKKSPLAGLLIILISPLGLLPPPLPRAGQLISTYTGLRSDGEYAPPLEGAHWSSGQELWIMEEKPAWVRVQVGQTQAWIPTGLVRDFP